MIELAGLELNVDKDTVVTVVAVTKEGISLCDGAKIAIVETDMKLNVGDLLKPNADCTALELNKAATKVAAVTTKKRNPPKDAFQGYNAL